ncbi:MAG TPA: citrate/2-methylcitrate synthase [Caulobacteraceae bacterium]
MTLIQRPDDRYMSAAEAAAALGVSVQTLYVYVGRKGIRSRTIPGSKLKRYWRADVERVRQGAKGSATPVPGDIKEESELTFITDADLFYRGRSVTQLAEHASFEDVAALLWNADPAATFSPHPPAVHPLFAPMNALLMSQSDVDRATSLAPILEEADPRAFDLTPAGMARTGADVLRWLAALTVRAPEPSAEPIHLFVARHLKRPSEEAELIRRLLVLWADHGFEPGAFAVRAVASAGVTPWRAVITGLSVSNGRRNRLGRLDATYRFLLEIEESSQPETPIVRRLRDGEALPGFDPPVYRRGEPIYRNGDPRARALLQYCDEILWDDPVFRRFRSALDVVREVQGLEPNNLLVSQFIYRRLGLSPRGTLFHLSRAAGWIAHAIEQHQTGEMEHGRGLYIGPLPA